VDDARSGGGVGACALAVVPGRLVQSVSAPADRGHLAAPRPLGAGFGIRSSMSAPLLPQAFWFRLAMPCRRIDGLPKAQGRLLDLPGACALPGTAALEGRDPWAEVRVAWNPGGLAVAVEATRRAGTIRHDPEASEGVEVWVDTRDTRTIHRASRFCHRFLAVLAPRGRATALDVAVAQKTIHRALADAPSCRPEAIPARAERLRGGWRLELFLPAEALHGFDPETNRRLGFCYRAIDPDGADQFLGAGREFPVGEDPSLWSTLELRDGAIDP
jgi:hypothetical protein